MISRAARTPLALAIAIIVPAAGMAAGAAAQDTASTLEAMLERSAATLAIDDAALDADLLRTLYRPRGYRPLWVGPDGRTERARAVLDGLRGADEDGLIPSHYGVDQIAARLGTNEAAKRAELDLLLTAGAIRYARDVKTGRVDPVVADSQHTSAPRRIDAAGLIAELATSDDLARSLAAVSPTDTRYRRLKAALATYRKISAEGGWPTVPPGRALKRGATDPRVSVLRRRLAATGDLGTASENDAFDSAVEAAVMRFQGRHGLAVDGIVGRETMDALNAPVETRIRQIRLNLERRRWLAPDLGPRYVFVNIADATVKYVELRDGVERTLLDMRAVVGRPYRRTPVFSSRITRFVVNPSWYVPASIARRDIVPKAAMDPTYIDRERFQVFERSTGRMIDPETIEWKIYVGERFPYLLRQMPGAENALGRIKFDMPNRFDVYLHDTPARALLSHSTRAFSSGCIRLEKPIELAALILENDPRWSRADLESAIASGRTSTLPLAATVPVHIAYLTAFANKDGTVHFRRDVYDRDGKLAAALGNKG